MQVLLTEGPEPLDALVVSHETNLNEHKSTSGHYDRNRWQPEDSLPC